MILLTVQVNSSLTEQTYVYGIQATTGLPALAMAARTSVAYGKGVRPGVDLGGSRIIKKQSTKQIE
nr:hypothetical protein [Klebsiella pneumoniae]